MVITKVDILKEGEGCYRRSQFNRGSCYRGGHFNGHVTEVVTLMEGEWSRYRGGDFYAGRMVMLQRWSL